ncbi:hypothetical protein [Naumannella halotolerans]|uniref:Uncharacterized protein n=1 Tax=Naumannella halotolerans TaxID=993414 RepID=A0A4R7J8R8_9ACTN|nr:hypothetical protein [Naumannella halotolerans]TDT32769.1 hypothetical protein CLV29_0357 [Naumannella halotolerans]
MLAFSLLALGCTPQTPDPSRLRVDPQPLAEGLREAVRADDPAAWQQWLDPQSGQAVDNTRLFDNLTMLQVSAIEPTGRQRSVAAGSATVEMTVTWTVPGWQGERTTPLWWLVTGAGSELLLLGPAPDDGAWTAPLWVRQPVVAATDGQVAVLAADDPGPWLAAAAEIPDTDGPMLITVAANSDLFAQFTGRDQVAAVTLPTDDGLQIVVNPGQTRQLSALGRGVLISHEAVHVATDSPHTGAPLWAEEGYAEFVAQLQWPQARTEMDRSLAQTLRTAEASSLSGLPGDVDFSGAAAGAAYGRALLAWRVIGEPDAEQVYRRISQGEPGDTALSAVGLTESELADRVDTAAAELADD